MASPGKWIDLYYGQSGTGKSEAIAAVIREIFLKTGKTARVAIGDGSGATYEPLVDAGIVEMVDYTTRDWPLTTMTQICTGHWPKDVLDPTSPMEKMTPEKFAKIGVYVIEGLSVGAQYIMGDKKGGFAEQASRGVKIAGDSPINMVDSLLDAAGNPIANSGPGTKFGGVTLGGYGQAQKRMIGFIEHSKGLPGWVIWTAHEKSSEDKISNQKLIGPEVAGGALTASLSRMFNNTLHFATAEKATKVKDDHTEKMVDVLDTEFRIYTRDHFRAEGNVYVKYKAVCRTPLPGGWPDPANPKKVIGAMPNYFTSDTPGESILAFYNNIRAAREQQMTAVKPPAAA